MNKQTRDELLNHLKKIKENLQDHALHGQQIGAEFEQLKEQKHAEDIQYIIESLIVAEKYSKNETELKKAIFVKNQIIPFDEIIALLKDAFQGKLNDDLQEILNSAEIELTVNKKDTGDPASARQLEIKINLAATVIDKYADLLSMIIGEKSSKSHDDLIQKSYKNIKELNDKLERINLIYSATTLKNNCQIYSEEYQDSRCCFSFFYHSQIKKQLDTIEIIINDLLQPGLATIEIVGGLLLLDNEISDIVEDQKTKTNLHADITKLLTSNNVPVHDKELRNQMIKAYISRAKFLEIQWPHPFFIVKEAVSAVTYPE